MTRSKKHITPNQLRSVRIISGLTLKEVAFLLNIKNFGRISEWENGLANPSIEHLIGLSVVYQRLPDQLYYELRNQIVREIEARRQLLKDTKGQARNTDRAG